MKEGRAPEKDFFLQYLCSDYFRKKNSPDITTCAVCVSLFYVIDTGSKGSHDFAVAANLTDSSEREREYLMLRESRVASVDLYIKMARFMLFDFSKFVRWPQTNNDHYYHFWTGLYIRQYSFSREQTAFTLAIHLVNRILPLVISAGEEMG